MITIRPSAERGAGDHGWLRTRHSFSFADYHDPRHMGFRSLRVINEDLIAPARGFPTHPHRDMEILTWVVAGELAHSDSMGNGSTIRPGEAQRMSAGTGVTHSEVNPSESETLHLLQIWIVPERRGLPPSYEQKPIPEERRRNRLAPLATPDGRDGSVTIHQDATIAAALLDRGASIVHERARGRHLWLQLVAGEIVVNGQRLEAGDGLATADEPRLEIEARSDADFLLFDLG